MWRVADPVFGVGLETRHPAPRTDQPDHLGHHHWRIRHVDQQRPSVHEVEGVRHQTRVSGVRANHLHPCQPLHVYEFGCHRDVHRVGVQAHDPTPWRHPLTQQLEDAVWAATHVDRAVAGPKADAIEQRQAVSGQLFRLTLQPNALAAAAAKRIDRTRVIDPALDRIPVEVGLASHFAQGFRHGPFLGLITSYHALSLLQRTTRSSSRAVCRSRQMQRSPRAPRHRCCSSAATPWFELFWLVLSLRRQR